MDRKFRCIKSYKSGEWLTEGKIYELDEYGSITYDDGYKTLLGKNDILDGTKIIGYYLEEIKEDKMREFKVGDKVRIISEKEVKKRKQDSFGYYRFDGNSFTDEMFNMCGKVATIFATCSNGQYKLKEFKEKEISWTYDMFESSKNSKSIHITFNDTTTHAVLKDGKDVIKRTKVGLYHEDEYKFETGVIEVVKKLLDIKDDKEEEVKPFVKAKVGDVIRIVKYEKGHYPEVELGDIHKVTEVYNEFINTNKDNSFEDCEQEYEIIEPNTSIISFSTQEILDELKRRLKNNECNIIKTPY